MGYNYMYYPEVEVSSLLGQVIREVRYNGSDEIRFIMDNDDEYIMLHEQDCCESVTVEDIVGDLHDLEGSPLLIAEEVSNGEDPLGWVADEYTESYTWTYYRFSTIRGSVSIRWYGTSNGYYGESVSFLRVQRPASE
jgi:hypothetical protein